LVLLDISIIYDRLGKSIEKSMKDNVVKIQEKTSQENNFNELSPADLIYKLLDELSHKRSKDIIVKRFGLDGNKKKTLEEIGKEYGITRERVRQIEASTLIELKKSKGVKHIKPLEDSLEFLLSEHGELMGQDQLVGKCIDKLQHEKFQGNLIEFILKLSDRFVDFKENENLKKAWGLKNSDIKKAEKIIALAAKSLEEKNKPFSEDKFTALISSNSDLVEEMKLLGNNRALLSYLNLSKKIQKNPYNEWGLNYWNEIMPRGVRDKAYVVLKKNSKPLHFRDITKMINEKGFSKKQANMQTVHNELIKDSRFILVGRGIYALKEWGYKEGTVKDIISSILKKKNEPLAKNIIIKEVLKQRMVKENTIVLTLQDKNLFQRVEKGTYRLAE